jgi:amino acid adenylation domain-containing protein
LQDRPIDIAPLQPQTAWNDTARAYPPGFVHEQAAAAARRHPEALAVASGGERLTYGELETRANRLAHHLRSLGVRPESRVAILMERTPARVVAVLAVLKAGGAYVSLDPANPAERLAFQIADSGSGVVLTQPDLADRLPAAGAVILPVDSGWSGVPDEGGDVPPDLRLVPENLAYVVYTSGSTGTPKGVEIPHAGLWNLVAWHRELYSVTAADRATVIANPAFDASVWEVWPYLTAGASLHIPEEAVRLSPEALARWWAAEGITLSFLPTPLAEAVMTEIAEMAPEGLALRALIVGGDRLHRGPVPGASFRLMNHYGPSEASVVSTVERVSEAEPGMPSIGRPIANLRVHVLDEEGEPVPVTEPGELCVAGVGLARGYLARPDLTAEKFVPDPFATTPGERMYRTGDLARRRQDGRLDFLGRIDNQVKLRGLRIELGEIEAALARHPAIRKAAVLLREGLLVAYLGVPGEPRPAAPELRSLLAERLPDYMVPAAFVMLDALPLTPNGKVDRSALSRIEPAVEREGTGVAPATPMEAALAQIFAEVLGVAAVGADDDFFSLGGHSLLATRVLSRVRRSLGVTLQPRALFEAPTVAALARIVAEARGVAGEPEPAPLAAQPEPSVPADLPLSYAQRRLWFLDQLTPGSGVYNVPLPLRLAGRLDPAALAASLGEIVRRHEVLRTTYENGEEGPFQVVHPAAILSLPVADLSALPEEHRHGESRRLLAAEAARPFDLATGPVLRAALLRLAEPEHLLLLAVHHIVFDGWSLDVLLRELAVLYAAASAGEASPLPELPIQYADYARWQQRWLQGEVLGGQLGYWVRQLGGAEPLLDLPADHPRPAVQSFRGGRAGIALSASLAEDLRALARSAQQSPFMLVLAAFQALLRRYTGRDDLPVGSPIANRHRPEVEGIIGFFANTVVLRGDLAGDPSFREAAERAREVTLQASAHQDLPFERLVEELHPERDLAYSPLFQVMLTVENAPHAAPGLPGLRLELLETGNGTAKFDLLLSLTQQDDGELRGWIEYAADLFEPATIERLAGHFRTLLAGAVARPDRRLSELPLLSPAEQAEILALAGLPGVEFAWEGCVHERFAAWARRTPQAVAAVYEGESLTYGELDARAGRLARRLRRLGVGPESRVALFCERSPEMLVAILGVLKAGGAYVPLDPHYPAERVAFVLADAGVRAVLTQAALTPQLPATSAAVLLLEEDGGETDGGPFEPVLADPAHAAYVIYTSGSTGQPKGVVVGHGEAARLLTATQPWFDFGPGDVWTLFHSYAFDFSVWEIWGALAHGGRLVVVPYWVSRAPEAFLDLLARERVTVLNQTPSAFRQLVLAEGAEPVESSRELALRFVIFGGEALEMASLGPWFDRHGDERPRLVNMYGITETTVHVTYRPLSRADLGSASVVGVPIPDLQVHVLDRALAPSPLLVPGEIAVGGAGLARGYLNRPELTAERFVPDPFGGRPGARLYRSGDLARRLPGGELVYLGRIDQQVKIRGFRIELGEIEAALASHPSVGEAAVLALPDAAGGSRLVACVAGSAVPDVSELRAFLKGRLPEPMVPSGFVLLDALPLTPNGKVDRRALSQLSRLEPAVEREGTGVAPATALEMALAKIFGEVLGVAAVGANDDFFELGGHSLLAVRVVREIRRLGADLTVRALFEHPTVAGLARAVEAAGGHAAQPAAIPAIPRAPRDGRLPLSFPQSRLWFLDRLDPGSATYNVAYPLHIEGVLDVPALAAALGEIVRRHEVLRTTYAAGEQGEPFQVIAPAVTGGLPVVDLSVLPEAGRRAEAGLRIAEDAGRPFDLARGPVRRFTLLRLGEGRQVLLLTFHHIAFDGWSLDVLGRELAVLYGAAAAGRPSPLPELPVQYADYARWQRQWLRGEVLGGQLGYWVRQLGGAEPVLDLPLDRPRPAVQSFRGGRAGIAIPATLAEDLKQLGRSAQQTPFMLVLAAFQALLQRYTERDDLLVGTPIANRQQPEIEGLIGLFVNTVVLRCDLADDPPFREAAARAREVTLQASAHQDLPFERLVEELHLERDLSRSPLFQVMLTVESEARAAPGLPGLRVESLETGNGMAKFDLLLSLAPQEDGGLGGWIEYAADLFEQPTVERLAGHFRTLLAGAVASPDRRLSELPLLSGSEQAQLAGWNATAEPRAEGGTLHGLFAAQAARTPDAVAVVAAEGALTYRELDERSDRLAGQLAALGAGIESRLGLLLERSLEMVVALLGVLKAGAAYVPLDPDYPADRLAAMLEDAQPVLVLAQERLVDRLPASTPVLCLDRDWEAQESGGPTAAVPDQALAYLIFTSGSTGRPKATMVAHRSIVNHMQWMQAELPLGPADRVLQKTAFSFDASVWEFWAPLLAGATLVMARPGAHREPVALIRAIQEHGVTVLQTVPSVLRALLEDGRLGSCRSLRRVCCGGEALTADVQTAFFATLDAELINLYGPTETTVEVTFWRCERERADRQALLGGPIPNARLHGLGRRLEPCPVGVPGELYVGGVPVSRGYLGRPEETALRFVPDPFAAEPGERLYRTGDRVRRRPDGLLESLGRVDQQVKIRGFRVELGEIEAVLASHPAVGEAAVLALPDAAGGSRLMACVAGPEVPGAPELRAFLKSRLPEHMVPSGFVTLASLPLTLNGKVDRRALSQLSQLSRLEPVVDRQGAGVAPATPIEVALAKIFCEVLGVTAVGANDDFFDHGGHSLLAVRVVTEIRRRLGVDLSVRAVFEHPTVAGLAPVVEAAGGHAAEPGAVPAIPAISRGPRDGRLPLSYPQSRLWFLDQLDPGTATYNIPYPLRIEGDLDVPALVAALGEIVRRHEPLRTTYAAGEQGEPFQVIAPAAAGGLPVVDLSALPEVARQAETGIRIDEDARRPFDLVLGPVRRFTLLRLGGGGHVLLLTVHHIAFDGWSLDVLLRELAVLYAAAAAGEPSPLPELPVQYADYALWQRRWLQGEVLAGQLAYWVRQLGGAETVLDLPLDHPRPAVQSFRGGYAGVDLSAGLTGDLKRLARSEQLSPFMLVLAAFQALLQRYTGLDDLLVGSPIANRHQPEIEDLIGFFVNTVVLRGDLADDPPFREAAARAREVTLQASTHQDLPFERLVEELHLERDLSRSPLFQVMLTVESEARAAPGLPGLHVKSLETGNGMAKFDLLLSLAQQENGGLRGWIEYAADLFERPTVERLAGHFRTLLAGAVAVPERRLSELPLLSPAEQAEILALAGLPGVDFAWEGCVHERFAAWAQRTPQAVAAVYEGESLTYGELDARAGRLARRLRRLGVGPESWVALFCERSLEMVVAVLGVLKAGGAYVPLDPHYPAERVAFVLADAGVRAILTQTALAERLPATSAAVLLLEEDDGETDGGPFETVQADPAHAAYVIYTSGSTGRPKGVVVGHGEAARLLTATQPWFHFGPEDVWTLFHSYAFDFSVWEIWGALAHGGRLVVVPYWVSRAPEAFLDLLARERVTVLNQTPSAFRQLVLAEASGAARELALRFVIFGGEALEMASLGPWFDRHGDERPRLVNMYGITETTVHVTYRPLSRADLGSASVVGVPIPDLQVHVLDRALAPSPLLVPGEIVVGGAGLARGYLNRPELTAERFVPDPFGGRPGARLYRSGDLARRLPGGELAYLGRIDQQVKIRGFRIELGEIEAALASHPSVGEAAVLALPDAAGGSRLVACVAGSALPDVSELRSFLKARLPEPMVPSGFVLLDVLPLTPNGKVDRRALSQLSQLSRLELAAEPEGTGVAPATALEMALAKIFGEVLGLTAAVGANADFFSLGGHSLLAVRVVTEIRRSLGADLTVRALFEHPTVAGLARAVEAAGGHAAEVRASAPELPAAVTPAIPRAPRDGRLPLSYPQSRLWFLDQLDPGSASYNIPFPLRVEGPLDASLLAAAMAEIVRRHEAMRTTFAADERGEPYQVVAPAEPPGTPDLPSIDLSALPGPSRHTEAARLAGEDGNRPFDLARGPVVRFALLRLAAAEHLLLLTMHHVAFDGWSTDVLLGELAALYEAGAAGLPSPLPELPVQYADFAVWQRRELADGALAGQLDYWRQRLAGAPTVLELPADRPRPAAQSFRGGMRSAAVPMPSAELRAVARRGKATPFMLMLAAFSGLLQRLTGRDDLLVGTPIANRELVEIEGLIGFFVNTLVLRAELGGDPDFGELLRRTREAALSAYGHQDLPFDVLVDELRPERDPSRSPLVQVMLVMEAARELPHPPGLRLTAAEHGLHPARFDLTLSVLDHGDEVEAVAEYAADLFEPATIDRLLAHFGTLLAGAAASPDVRLSELPLLRSAERHQMLAEWGDTAAELPPCGSVLDLFAARARRAPEAVAVVHGSLRVSYGELAAAANRLARHLRRLGVGPEVPVALAAERSVDMVVGLLGVLAAGGAYVPLDPAYPRERLAFMLEDCGAPVLVTQSRLLAGLPAFAGRRVILDESERIAAESSEPLGEAVELDSLAYVIYTSGSTGQPKGVQVAHRGLVNLTLAQIELFDLKPGRRALQFASFSFDASVSEIFTALVSGAELHLADRDDLLPGPGLARLVRERGITTATLTPSTLTAFEAAVPGDGLGSISTLVVAGEACPPELAARWSRGRRFLNAYGPTEATICASAELGAPLGAPTLGYAIANTRLLVLDAALQPVPAGVEGEIAIAGVGLARGYLGRPDLTADRFLPDPSCGGRVYRTGDRGRFLADGRLEFLGRVDHQIKIRGFRIEPGEIEAALLRLPGLREAVVMAREDAPGDRRLVAYVVPATPVEGEAPVPADIRRALLAGLPEHMVPSAVVVLPALPLTPNGKLDRKALPRPEHERTSLERPFVPPAGAVEEMVAVIWCAVLGVERVSADDLFFDLGGHSLLATQVISRLRAAFGVDLPVRALFEAPTVARLAARVEALRAVERGSAAPASPVIVPVPRDGAGLPLSFAQSRLWLLDRLEPGSPLYNLPQAMALSGALDRPALAAALGEILRRHEVLRTRFAELAGEPVQLVEPAGGFSLPLIDLAAVAGPGRLAEAARLAAAEAARPFDLAQPPLLRAFLLRLEPEEHRLLLTLHHIASDGWSQAILVRELTALYAAFAAGRPSPLPPPPLQYADFAAWQRSRLSGETLAAELDHWRRRLAGAPDVLDLPTDRPRAAVRSTRGGELERVLPAATAGDLARLARQEGVTLFMLLLAAFDVLLYRYTRQEEILVGSPIANRNRAETEGLLGFFVNTLVLRADLTGAPDFRELLRRTREATLEAYEHQDLPFEKLVEELHPDRSLSHTPLFQVMLALQNAPDETLELPGLTVRPLPGAGGTAKFDLTLFVEERGGELRLGLEYAADLFLPATMDRLLSHFARLLAGAAAAPRSPVAELPLLSLGETEQILVEWNDTAALAQGDACLHQLFEAQALRTPDAVALVAPDGGRLTYRELDARASHLSRRLRALGVGPEILAGVMMDRTADLVVALLAVLKAGGAYVPIDPAYPPQRVAFMLESSRAPVLLSRRALLADFAGSLPPAAVPLFLDAGWEAEPVPPSVDGAAPIAGNLAYIIFTSGSTGTPKGVALEHRSAVVFARWAREVFPPEDLAAVLAATSVCFDLSVFEIFVTLAWGGTVVLAENALALPAHPAAAEVTLVNTVPSAMAELVRGGGIPPSVRTVNLAGEALKGSLVRSVYEQTGATRVFNLYGPSEDTTYSTFALMPRDVDSPSIGRPVAGSSAYVLDAALQPVPIGVPGAVYLSGLGLSRGYLERPDLTADRFVPDPFGAPGARLYRVGDLARFRPDGEMEFLGRIDHQVKVRGFRIELGEVEAALAALDSVKEGAVLALEEPGGEGSRLTAFVVPAGPVPPPAGFAAELRAALKRSLPEYMVPTVYAFLPELPLTPNGKLDRRALERLAPSSEESAGAGSGAPRTPLEELVAGLWCEVLGLERVGVDDSFFDLGGHSLLATRVISRLRQVLGADLPLRALFEAPTVAALALRVEEARAGGRGIELPALAPAPRDDRGLPLSHSQRRLWLVDQLEPGSPQYNIPQALELLGALDVAALAAALTAIVNRYEVLRTRFAEVEGEPVQIPGPGPSSVLRQVDLSGLPSEDLRREEAGRLGTIEAMRPFDLAQPPLLRAILLRLGDEEHRLLLTVHHIASDGWSQGILDRELGALYAAFAARQPSPLSPVALHYADFAAWQRSWLAGDALDRELAWWKERLAGAADVLDLPADRPRPAVRSSRGAHLFFKLPAEVAPRLPRMARREGVTPFMATLSAFEVLLYRYSGQESFLVGSPIANRNRAETESLVGFFVNTLVLRADLGGDPELRELLRRTREVTLEAYDHQDVPFEKLVEELRIGRSLSHTPLFQVMLVTEDGAAGLSGSAGSSVSLSLPGLTVRPLSAETGTAKFDLTLGLQEVDGVLHGVVEYSTELFDAATMERLTRHLATLLAAVPEAPERRIGELPLLSAEERYELLAAWNDTRRNFADIFGAGAVRLVHEEVTEQARLYPEALAVAAGSRRLTYGELAAQSNRLAHHLGSLGVGPESRVAVFMERSPERVVAVLAVLLAGGAYVSLDPGHPPERLAFQIADAGSSVVLTHNALADRLPDLGAAVAVLRLDARLSGIAGREDAPPAVDLLPESLAYVIYTSGSTGIPKGVEIPHRGLSNLVAWHRDLYRVTAADRATLIANPAFDASVWEIWPYLTAGASLHVPDAAVRVAPEALLRWFAAEAITLSFLPTPLGEAMLEEELPADLALRAMIVGGDRLHRGVPLGAPFRLVNHYGPTEASVVATFEEVAEPGVPSIGRPIANLRVYILDRAGQPAPSGVPGELCLAGEGLARGYLERPDLTAEKFQPEPFSGAAGARMYRTGDLARWRRDGKIDFLGRLDHQVKVRGLRIELGEIEAALAAHPAVRDTSVLLREGRLVGYLSTDLSPAAAGVNLHEGELRTFLAERLPEYMVPAAFVVLAALPLTANGKVDRKALAALPPPSAEAEAAGPRTPLEAALAAIWADLLGLQALGVHDNFFELGGHSLLATRMISRLRSALGVDVPLVRLFEAPTVAGLAALLEAEDRQAIPLPPIARAPRPADGLPLSLAQQRLWLLDRVEPGSPAFNVPTPYRLRGWLDVPALAAALAALVARHEVLRTVFFEIEGNPRQRFLPAGPVPLPVLDLAALPAGLREPEGVRWAGEEGRLPFYLARGPLFRASLVRLAADEHILCLNAHHVVTDGWSAEILVRELLALYAAAHDGLAPDLPDLPLQYPDFAVWQRRALSAEVTEALLARWKERFGTDLPTLRLPTDRPRPAVQTINGAHRSVLLPGEVLEAARALSNRRGATLFMTFLAAFQALLHRYSGQPRIVVGSPMAGRGRPELEGMVGFFVNTVVLPVDVADDMPFERLIDRVRDSALAAYACQDLPFEKLVETLQPDRDRSRSPLFQVMFTFLDNRQDAKTSGSLALDSVELGNATSQFDLSLFTADQGEALWVGVEYNTDLFEAATIDRLLDHYGRFLTAALAAPSTPVAELPPAAAELPKPLAEPAAAAAAAVPDVDARRDRLAARMSKLSDAQREAMERRLRGGG